MNTNRIHSAAKSTQSARRNYFATLATEEAPAWLIEARAAALRISTDRLVRECGGSQRKAVAAEVAYIASLTA